MYYSSIGILACLILFIINYDLLFKVSPSTTSPAHKAYKRFLIGVIWYYITDVVWELLNAYKLNTLTFIETGVYFLIMALAVMLWTKYVIIYLNNNKKFSTFLKITGWIFLVLQIIILIANFFYPIAFWFDEDGTYYTGIARNINLFFQIILFFIIEIWMIIYSLKAKPANRRRYQAIGFFSVIMMIFAALQAVFPLAPFYSMGYMLGTCLLHTFVLEDEKDDYLKKIESIIQIEKIQEKELGTTRKLAYSDPLTGVKNKMAYLEDVACIDHRIEENFLSNFAIIIFDINDLKVINDTKGHEAGDQYIKEACSLICSKFKRSPVYRIGGDEFIAFLLHDDFINRQSLITEFNSKIDENLSTNKIIIASGYAEYSPKIDDCFLSIFERADKNMYKRKSQLKTKKRLK